MGEHDLSTSAETQTISRKVERVIKKLTIDSGYNSSDDEEEEEKDDQENTNTESETGRAMFVTEDTNDYLFLNAEDPLEPQTFQETWWHEDLKAREKWRNAIRKEFKAMIDLVVWRYRKIQNVPEGRRLIGTKWVFNIKRNGIFRARLVR